MSSRLRPSVYHPGGRRHQRPHTRRSSCHRRPGSGIAGSVPRSSPLFPFRHRCAGLESGRTSLESARRAGAGNRGGQGHAAMHAMGVIVRGGGLGRLTPRRSDSFFPGLLPRTGHTRPMKDLRLKKAAFLGLHPRTFYQQNLFLLAMADRGAMGMRPSVARLGQRP
jgi:hypothetical protein